MADEQLAANFSRLMSFSKTKTALRLLSTSERGGVLTPKEQVEPFSPESQTVLDVLKEKHPPAAPVAPKALVAKAEQGPLSQPILFTKITGGSNPKQPSVAADLLGRLV